MANVKIEGTDDGGFALMGKKITTSMNIVRFRKFSSSL